MGSRTRALVITVLMSLGCPREGRDPPSENHIGRILGVVSASGAVLAGASVCAWREGPRHRLVREEIHTPICTETNAAGVYVLALPSGIWWVGASAREHLPTGGSVALRASKPSESLALSLDRGGRAYAGMLADLAGAPIRGARVATTMMLDGFGRTSATTTTDEHGRYELWSGEESELHASAPGFARMIRRDEQTHVLLPESVIAGRVIDEHGNPVPNARVAHLERFGAAFGFPWHATRTDWAGEFRLTRLMPGRYQLLATNDRAAGVLDGQYVDYAQTLDGVVITLEKPLKPLRARVVAPDGEPVTGCSVHVATEASVGVGAAWVFWTDEEGMLDVPVPEARYAVRGLGCAGLVGKPPYDPITAGASGDAVPTLAVEPGRVLRGDLLDAAGTSPVGQRVWIQPDPLDDRTSALAPFMDIQPARTEANGRFEIVGLAPGSYELTIEDWYGIRQAFTIADKPITELSFTIPTTGRIELRSSVARAGQEFAIKLCDVPGAPTHHVWSDAHGHAVVRRARSGRYRIALDDFPDCNAEAGGTEIELAASATRRVEFAAVDQWSSELIVQVLTADGEPATNVAVELDRLGFGDPSERLDWTNSLSDAFVITDAEGRAHASGSPERGQWVISAARPGEFGSAVAGPEIDEITIRLRSSRRL